MSAKIHMHPFRQAAIQKAQDLLDQYASRSRVCSFINELESGGLTSSASAASLSEILMADRDNARPVLRIIIKNLQSLM